ncbi:MAG: amidohydrolase family protein [Cellulosilyticaceae bacterium]
MNERHTFILKGHIIYSASPTELKTYEDHYLICEDGKVVGVYDQLPPCYQDKPMTDYGNRLIIPGLVDLHLHAPQYPFMGSGMDMELIPWLNHYAFVEEAKYQDLGYAQSAYSRFVSDLVKSPTTRAVIFATLHVPATQHLMTLLEQSGLDSFVGKVNMDRNSPDTLCETTEDSIAATKDWLGSCQSTRIKPILTPRFVPSCSDDLLAALGQIAKESGLPVQSHLSENKDEIAWVSQLHPRSSCYGNAYEQYGLFGNYSPTIMAHCVHPTEVEMDLLASQGIYVAHCPQSNTNLSSGIAPIRKMLARHIRVGLGTDVAGGASLSLFRAMTDAIQVSKLYRVLCDADCMPLTLAEVFYMATKGGGSFWGAVGSFEPGYAFDALVIDDTSLQTTRHFTLPERLERMIYLATDQNIVAKYVNGISIL